MSSRSNRTGVYELPETPTLAELFKVYGRRLKLSIRTNTVGTVVSYNPTNQTATVRVDILQIVKVLSSLVPGVDPNLLDTTKPSPPFVITDIPVAWPRAGGGYLTFPLIPGDTGELAIQDRGLSQWLNRPADLPVDPIQAATHALSDAVFHPGVHTKLDAITPPTDLTGAVLHHDVAIKLGRAAALGVARLTDTTVPGASMTLWETQVTAALVAMAALFNAVPGPVLSAGPGTIPVFPVAPPSDLGIINSASAKVSSE